MGRDTWSGEQELGGWRGAGDLPLGFTVCCFKFETISLGDT